MHSPSTSQHKWLQHLLGDWTFVSECSGGPDQPVMKSEGRESVRSVGDLWIVGESHAEMPGGEGAVHSVITIGFDPTLGTGGRFVGTWFCSVWTKLFHYEGDLDEATNVLPLNSTGPNPMDLTKIAHFQDIIELHGPDRRVFRSQMKDDHGNWVPIMRAEYTRVK
jgi:hypothetical protein